MTYTLRSARCILGRHKMMQGPTTVTQFFSLIFKIGRFLQEISFFSSPLFPHEKNLLFSILWYPILKEFWSPFLDICKIGKNVKMKQKMIQQVYKAHPYGCNYILLYGMFNNKMDPVKSEVCYDS